MAARPNTLRTLEYGKKLVDNQLSRVNDMIAMAEKVLADNKTLTPEDISGYKACIATGKKQITLLARLAEVQLPTVTVTTARKRGRPSKAELEQLAAARGEKPAKQPKASKAAAVAAAVVAPVTAPKKRGRKSKATIAAEAAAAAALAAAPVPKKRGRPAKVKTEAPVQAAPAASKVSQDPPAKRRGRPAKVKSDLPEAVEAVLSAEAPKRAPRKPKSPTPAINVAPITEGEPVKRGPGRPKGSKNKVTLNGQNAEVVTA